MKVAIVYDRVNKIGGAERVLESLSELFTKPVLFTSIYNKKNTPWARKFTVKTSYLQNIPILTKRHELIPYLMPFAFESFDFTGFDLVISVTSEAAKGIIVPPNVTHICICLTPTRYLWSGYKQYFRDPILKFLASPLVWYLRKWDLSAATRPDEMIAISKTVQKRIKKYYKRESLVIYPPADRLFKNKLDVRPLTVPKKYFLVVSRLVDYKKIDLAVKACTKLKLNLIVIGEGNELERLTAIAGDTIEFKGKVSDEELLFYYKNCRALLFPGEEDFGITMVEVQLAGKPVVAFKAGGALEIVEEGVTGVFFTEQTVGSLVHVLKNFKDSRYNDNDCKKKGRQFSEKRFKSAFTLFLKRKKFLL
jgi:glycosyltransferase involved in cell wall biosynthesis